MKRNSQLNLALATCPRHAAALRKTEQFLYGMSVLAGEGNRRLIIDALRGVQEGASLMEFLSTQESKPAK